MSLDLKCPFGSWKALLFPVNRNCDFQRKPLHYDLYIVPNPRKFNFEGTEVCMKAGKDLSHETVILYKIIIQIAVIIFIGVHFGTMKHV